MKKKAIKNRWYGWGVESEERCFVFFTSGQGSLYGISIDLNTVNALERLGMLEEQQCELVEWQ